MKDYFKSIIVLGVIFYFNSAFGQDETTNTDIVLGNNDITPKGASFPSTETIQFSLTFQDKYAPNGSSVGVTLVTISLSRLQGSDLIVPTGTLADKLDWEYNPLTNQYIGKMKDGGILQEQYHIISK